MPSPRSALRRRPLLALLLLIVLLLAGYAARAVTGHGDRRPSGSVALSALPAPARQLVADLRGGGTTAGAVYGNPHDLLPVAPAGGYREYPVPGASGSRWVVTGPAGAYYYTADGFVSFSRVELSG